MKIFSVHDAKAEAYLPPFYMRTTGEAERAFSANVKDTSTQFSQFPSDYTLVELGTFDEDTAQRLEDYQIIENGGSIILYKFIN